MDPHQFGTIPRSSTQHAYFSVIHNWAEATDAMLLDYRKAFDLIDRVILAKKICGIGVKKELLAGWLNF